MSEKKDGERDLEYIRETELLPNQRLKKILQFKDEDNEAEENEEKIEKGRRENKFTEHSLSLEVVMLILQFNIEDYSKLLRLSRAWNLVIREAIDDYCYEIERQFILIYGTHLSFVKSVNSVSPLQFCGNKGVRLDRLIQCEVLNNKASYG